MKRIFSAFIFCAVLTGQGGLPAAAETEQCPSAGPGASFCAGSDFSRVDTGGIDGLSYWMDDAGYLSKVVVEAGMDASVNQAVVESHILSMVTAQASEVGRAFEFRDLKSARSDGADFGTISYSLAKAGRAKPILHSYVLVGEIVVQVISQAARKGTARDAAALLQAHRRAIDAIELKPSGETL
jgi:hypothetical protein